MNEKQNSTKPRFTCSMTRKVNLGNYESTDFFMCVSWDSDEDMQKVLTNFSDQSKIVLDEMQDQMNKKITEVKK
jgi:hypothetical protein